MPALLTCVYCVLDTSTPTSQNTIGWDEPCPCHNLVEILFSHPILQNTNGFEERTFIFKHRSLSSRSYGLNEEHHVEAHRVPVS